MKAECTYCSKPASRKLLRKYTGIITAASKRHAMRTVKPNGNGTVTATWVWPVCEAHS